MLICRIYMHDAPAGAVVGAGSAAVYLFGVEL